MNRASVNGTIQARQRKPSGGSRPRSVGALLKVGLSALFLASTFVCGARADVITDWNEQAVAAGYSARQFPVRQLAVAKQLDVMTNARLFALVAMATADSMIAVFDAKYAYRSRP